MPVFPAQDIVVIGGGIVGAAVAWGLARAGLRPLVLDGEDLDLRAARANFGLIEIQGKGLGALDYARWTITSARNWPELAAALETSSGIDVRLRQRGTFCFATDESFLYRSHERVCAIADGLGDAAPPHRLLDHEETARMVPEIGPRVVGSIYSSMDGEVNPLRLFRALHTGMLGLGALYAPHHPVKAVAPKGDSFQLVGSWGTVHTRRVVLCAGVNNPALCRMVGLDVPLIRSKGQVLVTEKCRPFLHYASTTMRQTDEGSVMIGESEETGTDTLATNTEISTVLADRALRIFPQLKAVNVVRSWTGFRVKTADGLPVYQQSARWPGAYVVTSHSGVTLAANHALIVAPEIARGASTLAGDVFSNRRFHVS
ncbi:NAD(P)/FAD-dependent oxidoreductase [Brucella intermedia]|uniref:NAD(P)/FAD-dependent oxidoreductase n=1 Tax=Brucella intermedia TaxID=94625 RepID=UPI00224896D5|nr:FAD-dependent oxidoreductase [Brucella intermedia]